ncbi:MAG: SGNH/GDSL hydrolase family protein, partial [Clostridia bacterium]|nr:SGNH/GDSL hydrolase family protein [Clostridia bacterium]
MRKNNGLRIALRVCAALIASLLALSAAVSCGRDVSPDVTTVPDATENPGVTSAPDVTGSEQTSGGGTDDASSTAVETEPVETDARPGGDPSLYDGKEHTIEVSWSYGYVGSESHSSYAYRLNPTGKYYSISEPIVIKKAGTRISFIDDNSNSNGDTAFASGSALVVSTWSETNGKYVIDRDGANYTGSGNNDSDVATYTGGVQHYSYVSSLDGEIIRLGYRSGETADFKPAKYPAVTVKFTGETGTMVRTAGNAVAFAEYVEAQKALAGDSALIGKTIYAIGDSYFAGNGINPDYVWPAILAAKYSMNFINYGRNGSTISNYVTDKNPMCDRVSAMSSVQADIILFEGGKNDYNVACPIGNLGDTSTKTFYGAIDATVKALRA